MDGEPLDELKVDASSLVMPPVTLALTVLIAVGSVVGILFGNKVPWLLLHPLTFLPPNFMISGLATYPLVDTSVVNAIISLVSFPIFGKVLEQQYGSLPLLQLIAAVVLIVGAISVVEQAIEPALVGAPARYSDVAASGLCGAQPILMACFMALRQCMPDTKVTIFFLFNLRLRHLPVFAVSLTLAASILMPSRGAFAMVLAFPVSWIWLRYVSNLYNRTFAGDLRESFSLASFFPAQAQPYVMPLSAWLDSLRFWPAVRNQNLSTLPVTGADIDARSANLSASLMTVQAREHRAIATELVNERLQALEKTHPGQGSPDVSFSDTSFVEVTPIKSSAPKQESKKQ